MSRTIELPNELFEVLKKTAEASGLSPTEWIAVKLSASTSFRETPCSALLDGLVGMFDSRERRHDPVQRTLLGDLVSAKLEKQGLVKPE